MIDFDLQPRVERVNGPVMLDVSVSKSLIQPRVNQWAPDKLLDGASTRLLDIHQCKYAATTVQGYFRHAARKEFDSMCLVPSDGLLDRTNLPAW